MSARRRSTRIREIALSGAARPLRFAGTGGTAASVQVLLLVVLTRHGWNALVANGVAFLMATQVNFGLSAAFTWRDRGVADSLGRRWLLYHVSVALMASVNMLVFVLVRSMVPTVLASLVGIGAGAVGNYLLGDRLVFRRRPVLAPATDAGRCVA
jgi:putative flippase GtrA